jgi:hypothetical protein
MVPKIDDTITYAGIHAWLRRNFGNAKKCESCGNKKAKRYEWALKKGSNYKRLRELFTELCASCHRKQDITPEARENMAAAKRGKPSVVKGKHWKIKDTSKMKGRIPWNKKQ